MKKIYYILLLFVVSFVMAFAGDTVKVLRIYNNGVFNAVPLTSIDSIYHSKLDVDGSLQANYSSAVIETTDSTYNISINEIDSAVVTEVNIDEFKAYVERIGDYVMSAQDEDDLSQYQTNIIAWLNDQEWVSRTTINDTKDLIVVTISNGIDFYIDFQDASFFNEIDDFEENILYERESPQRRRAIDLKDHYFDVTADSKELIIDNPNLLVVQGRVMFDKVQYQKDEYDDIKNIISKSPVDIKPVLKRNSFAFFDDNLSDYGMIIISQTHGANNLHGAFQVSELSSETITNGGVSILVKDRKIIKTSNPYIWWVKPKALSNLIESNTIVYANYCYSYKLSQYLNNCSVVGFENLSNFFSNAWGLNTFIEDMACGKTFMDAYENDRSMIHLLWDPVTNKSDSKQRYFSISTDEITQRADNGNPIIKGKVNGINNLKDNLKYVAYCHEGADKFTPEDDDVIKIVIPANKINSDGTFEFEFQSETPLKSAIIYGFCFGFEYGDNTYYGETKLYGKFDGLEYEKKEEWCYVMSGNPTVLYSYNVTTHFEATKNQKDFWIALYCGDQLVATRPVNIEKGNNTQVTTIEFGCTKEDFIFDYANYKAKVDSLYLTAITNVTINGELTGITFNDPSEMVELKVTYEQKPNVQFTNVEVKAPSFSGDDALIGYVVQAASRGTLFIESVRLVTEGEYWEKFTHDAIKDLISDNGIVSDYGILTVSNYKYLNNAKELSSLIGYFEIKGPQLDTMSSNYIQFTSSNGKYITGAKIVEGKPSVANVVGSTYDTANYIATDRGMRSEEFILQDGESILGVKSLIPERWKNAPIIKRK